MSLASVLALKFSAWAVVIKSYGLGLEAQDLGTGVDFGIRH